ncbi:MAG: DUF3108 domain-containing protein [Bacteroidia bacterium]|nr:DUF3108 domain-containing protein [Bacteroidia bacterium]
MKYLRYCILTSILINCTALFAQYNLKCPLVNTAFKTGEELEYTAFFQWGGIIIDRLVINTKVTDDIYRKEDVYNISAIGHTEKVMRSFFSLRDTFQVMMRKKDLLSLYFYERDIERKYNAVKNHHFYPIENGMAVEAIEVKNGETKKNTEVFHDICPIDALALLYRIRNYNFSNIAIGESTQFTFYRVDGVLNLSITYVGKENITLRDGNTYRCLRFYFETSDGTLFSSEDPVSIWLTDDKNKIIVHAEAKLKIGYAKIDLVKVSKNRYPLHYIKKK